jgi:hypothetical protein
VRRLIALPALITVLFCINCSSEVSLLPSEEFRWCGAGLAVSFSPPAAPWERAKHQERDTGISFTRREVPPGLITVGEFLNVCHQDPRPALRELQARFDEYNSREFHKVSLAGRRFVNSGFSDEGNQIIEQVNRALTQAEIAYRQKNFTRAKQYVAAAVREGEKLDYRLEELVGKYLFNTEGFGHPERFRVEDPVSGVLCGVPSLTVNYTMDDPRGQHVGRKVYVSWDSHLFVFSYLGPAKYLPVLEEMLKTASFPVDEAPDAAQ